jgi:thioredoxin-like negative regulator of GroEL
MDSDGKIAKAWHVEAIPTLLVVDEQGKVVQGYTGMQPAMGAVLAVDLGIQNYVPQFGGQTDAGGH